MKLKDLAGDSVDGTKVVDGSLTGADVDEATLNGVQGPRGEMGPPGDQGPPGSPDSGPQILGKLAPVDGAGSGLDADSLDGQGANAFATAGSEALHVVDAAGEPPFETCNFTSSIDWAPLGFGGNPPGFFRDPAGVVHLQGNAVCAQNVEGQSIFTLPPGYRPSGTQNHLVVEGSAIATNVVNVVAAGNVQLADLIGNAVGAGAFIPLDGITFRCSPSGANGCP